jgi:hypothetical protein
MGEEHVEDQPLPNGSWRCVWCRADRAIRRHKIYKSPAGDVDLIRLGQ